MPQSFTAKLQAAPIQQEPFPHIWISQFVTQDNLKQNLDFDRYHPELLVLVDRFHDVLQDKYKQLGLPYPKRFMVTEGRLIARAPDYTLKPHLDSAYFAITCLYYIAGGGELGLYSTEKPIYQGYDSSTIYVPHCTLHTTIFTHPNVFVAFPNTNCAIHGVAPLREWRYLYQCHIMGADQ